MEAESRMVVARGWGQLVFNGDGKEFWRRITGMVAWRGESP